MQRLIILTSVLFALAACQSVVETSNSVILAPKDTSKPHAVIIALNGALCDPHSYISFFQTVQASSSYSLWVAFPKFFFDMPFFVGGAISSTLNDLKTLKANTSLVFVAGHSLGGVTGQDYANGNSAGIKGLILLGSYMQMKYEDPQVNFPVPVLTLSGELDGLSKLARLAISFNQMLRHPEQKGHLRYPVAIVPGATHSSFINGSVPGPVKNSDLKPEISNEEAWKTFARIINAFIDVQLNSTARKSSEKVLSDYVYGVSFPLVQPLLQAMTLEGNPHLSNQSIVGNTTWATDNVYYEMNLSSSEFQTQISMQEHGLIQFALDKPSVSFENNVLKHQIYVYKTYSWLQFFDVSQISYESADYIAVKYKGSDAIYRAANLSGTPGQITCRDINQKAIYQVLATLPEATVERYQKYGVKLVLGDDNVCSTGSSWLSTSLGFDDKGDYVVVSSPRLSTAVDSSIFPGMFYCKLFSPARIAEWIYTDSLRKNYNIKA